jgi:hypothetical protein
MQTWTRTTAANASSSSVPPVRSAARWCRPCASVAWPCARSIATLNRPLTWRPLAPRSFKATWPTPLRWPARATVRRACWPLRTAAHAGNPVDFFRTKAAIEQALGASGLDAVILRPTSFMEQHVHLFNGLAVLDKGKASLIGAGSKRRNFVCAADVAQFAVRALLEDPPPFRRLDIGGHDHLSNAEGAALYAREAGRALRTSHLPRPLARIIGTLAAPLHPGVARIMRLMSLPDDAFEEHFAGAAALESEYGVRLTRVDEFVRARVSEHRRLPGLPGLPGSPGSPGST